MQIVRNNSQSRPNYRGEMSITCQAIAFAAISVRQATTFVKTASAPRRIIKIPNETGRNADGNASRRNSARPLEIQLC